MSPLAEDSDPLLAFSIEPGEAAPVADPPAASIQPVAPAEDVPPPQAVDPLIARIDRLERELETSKKQVATLKSELATLVRAPGDNKKPLSRPVVAARAASRLSMRAAAAVAGIVIGLGLGIAAWMSLTGDGDVTMAASASTQPPVAASPPVAEAPAVSEAPKTPAPPALEPQTAPQAPKAPPAPQVHQAQAPQAHRYVGTLSIDSSPGGEVFLDRKRAGNTPLRLTNLRAGSHLVWIERDGYRRFTRVVRVPADRVSRVSVELEPLAAR